MERKEKNEMVFNPNCFQDNCAGMKTLGRLVVSKMNNTNHSHFHDKISR